MTSLILDTHAVIRYLANDPRLSTKALRTIRASTASPHKYFVPSICLVEATYLVERNRIPRTAFVLLIAAMASNKGSLFVAPLDLAVATAYAWALPLVTSDGKIRASSLQTIW